MSCPPKLRGGKYGKTVFPKSRALSREKARGYKEISAQPMAAKRAHSHLLGVKFERGGKLSATIGTGCAI